MSFSFAVYRPSPGRVFERIVALFGLIVLIPASFAPPAYATVVGATPGSHQVSPSGAFTYTIPIAVPPGTAGIEPKLSLSYNSQGGNGLLGMGWTLAGLSVIHRCPKTMVQDGVIGGVNYNANDRYCLDGQRLIAIAGTYGADATEYRTESESYSRIVSYGSQGSGPAWWKVWTKSGQILEYGNTADSRIEAQGKTEVMLWSLNKLSDTVGNYLTVSYIEDTPNGQYYPDRIDYTGNGNAGKTPGNSVRFVYETRPDITPLYQAGSLMKNTVRLTNVQTFAGTALVKDYRLAYELSMSTQGSRLTSFTECGFNEACLLPSILKWQGGPSEFFQALFTDSFSPQGSGGWGMQVADINGDGKSDLIFKYPSTNQLQTFLSNGDGTFRQALFTDSFSPQGSGGWDMQVADINGDGKSDLIFKYPSTNHLQTFLSNGDGTFRQALFTDSFSPQGSGGWDMQVADINGDGKSDLIFKYPSTNQLQTFLSNGDGTFRQALFTDSFSPQGSGGWDMQVADINGDGKSDLIFKYPSTNHLQTFLSNGDGTFRQALFTDSFSPQGSGGWGMQVADINGDGKSDLIFKYPSTNHLQTFLSNGDGTFRQALFTDSFSPQGSGGWGMQVADINGDGKSDLIFKYPSTNHLQTFLSNGDGTFRQALFTDSFSPQGSGGWGMQVADINGDGKSDLIFKYPSTNHLQTFLVSSPFPDFLSSFTTGLNATTTITYAPLTDNSVYSKDAGAVYPYVDVQSPLYVVSSVATSDGLGGTYSTYYSYAGAKSHLLGGGFLGFRQVTLRDYQADMYSVTTYRQDYPYQGQPLSTQKRTNGGVLLSQSLITYTDQLLNTGISPTWHQSLPTHTVESSYELTGGLISTVVTDTQYDAWGNPTIIAVDSGGGYNKTTTNTYDNIIDANRWFLGRLRRSAVTSVTP